MKRILTFALALVAASNLAAAEPKLSMLAVPAERIGADWNGPSELVIDVDGPPIEPEDAKKISGDYRKDMRALGVLLWGLGDARQHFFWLTDGEPSDWPVMAMYDFDFVTRFDMPMTVFLEQLLLGRLDCGFMGWKNTRMDPSRVSFHPRIPPAMVWPH